MLSKSLSFSAVLFVATAALLPIHSAHAQAPSFGLESTATTSGYASGYTDASGVSAFDTSASSDPASLQFDNGHGLVNADAGAVTFSTIGYIYAEADATATQINATAFGTDLPTGASEGRYFDTFTVKSNTLPAGTQVELVFHNAVEVYPDGSGLYTGTVQTSLQVGTQSDVKTWTVDSANPASPVASPELHVTARIGDTLTLEGKVRVETKAYYFQSLPTGPSYSGHLQLEAIGMIEFVPDAQHPDAVWVEYASNR